MIRAVADKDHVRIMVSDNGIGIPVTHLQRVFDPFFQVDQGGTRRYPGLGLGLSIVRDVVLAMEGEVFIESEPGQGTTVSVLLPRVTTAAYADEPATATDAAVA